MRNSISYLSKKIDEAKLIVRSRKTDGIQKLEEIKSQFHKEVNSHIEALYKRRNFVQEAFKKRLSLKKFRISFLRQLLGVRIRFLVSMPVIYGMIIPGLILHLCLEVYHRICFPLYGIHALRTRDYFVFDRHHLAYLNWFEKLNCLYCSYFNCLMTYGREIAALTELYWCPIKHAKRIPDTHGQYHYFVDYLDGEKYRAEKERLRAIAKRRLEK